MIGHDPDSCWLCQYMEKVSRLPQGPPITPFTPVVEVNELETGANNGK